MSAPRSERHGLPPDTGPAGPLPPRSGDELLKRLAMVAATAFLAINLWTGAPLLALWVGSQAVGSTVLSMRAVFVVVIVLALLVFSMAYALTWLNTTYDRMTGRRQGPRHMAWLRPMSAEGIEEPSYGPGVTPIERVVMVSVYLAVICFFVWFFALAGSPMPGL